MRSIILLLFLGFGFFTHAQEVISNGKAYNVKGDLIFKNGEDITSTLTAEEQKDIHSTLKDKLKSAEKSKQAMEDAIKAQKKAEKAQKRAEKDLRLKQKAQSNFEKANKRYINAQEKYEKLKRRGKLSPNDEKNWLDKLENLKDKSDKMKRRLNRT